MEQVGLEPIGGVRGCRDWWNFSGLLKIQTEMLPPEWPTLKVCSFAQTRRGK